MRSIKKILSGLEQTETTLRKLLKGDYELSPTERHDLYNACDLVFRAKQSIRFKLGDIDKLNE